MNSVTVNDRLQSDYTYERTKRVGRDFDPEFTPDLSPQQMLELGVFGGWYLNDCQNEYPSKWFDSARLSQDEPRAGHNYFQVLASQPLSEWQRKGWIYPDDPRGWFQWYCRYYMGRRLPEEDKRQIARWKAIRRHIGQLKKACPVGDEMCRPRQRQALLHWAYDSRNL